MDANGVTTESVGLHCLPIAVVKDEAETRSVRSPVSMSVVRLVIALYLQCMHHH